MAGRHTDNAKASFTSAKGRFLSRIGESADDVDFAAMCAGFIELSAALADIYDKLDRIEKKLSGPSSGGFQQGILQSTR